MTVQDFEDKIQNLSFLSECEETIDEFENGYLVLLVDVKERMAQARTVWEIKCCADQGGRLRALLLKQVSFVRRLKGEALVEDPDALAQVPAVEA